MPFRPVRLRAIAAAVGLVFLPTLGCSWISVRGPPQGPIQATPPLKCESSVAAPVADTVGAVLLTVGGGLVTVASLSISSCSYTVGGTCTKGANSATWGGIAAVGAGVALASSAAHGYSTTSECRHLKEAQLSCTSGAEEACRTLQERKK